MPRIEPRPLVGIPANQTLIPEHSIPQHSAGERYIMAVCKGSGADPLVIPAIGGDHDAKNLARQMDGLFLTGGRANVEPHHYGGPPFPDDEIRDPARDATVLPLIRACVDEGVPIFGVCRGIQEINVALGGSLHYRVHLVEGMMDHRMRRDVGHDERFGLRHPVSLSPGGTISSLLADAEEVQVNSLHGQGIDRIADALEVEALSPDGLVEAVRVRGSDTFSVGVQWHAEWRYDELEVSIALYRAFGDAARERARRRHRRRPGA